jgi:3-oxoacyl-[acyl-carrier protein] reductase
MKLERSVAVVTGGTEGIGRAVALALGRAGARVAICPYAARVEETVAALMRTIDAMGAPCDVASPEQVAAFADRVRRELDPARIVVNNAGIGRFAPLAELSLADWDATIATNLRSLYLVTRAFLADLVATAPSAIVNVASLAGRNGIEGGTAYCASKHAVLGFSKALMLEVRRHDVRVIAVCPGSVATPFMDKQHRPGRTARDRMLHADDVADTVSRRLTLPDWAMISEPDIRRRTPSEPDLTRRDDLPPVPSEDHQAVEPDREQPAGAIRGRRATARRRPGRTRRSGGTRAPRPRGGP